jgi:multiple sugar transport system substrate-binding protein
LFIMTTRQARIAAAIGMAAAVSLAAGCSSDGGTDGTDGTASGPVTIEYLHRLPDGEGMTAVADIVARWNAENPDIKVTATKFDGKAGDLASKLEADVKAGEAPCLAQVGYGEVPSLYTKGLFEDVSDEAAEYKDNFSSGTFSLMTVGDATVGLPQDSGPLVYYYNKAAFEELGLEVPTTGAEFEQVAQQAAKKGKYIAAFLPDEAQYWLSAQAAAAGATWYSVEDDAWSVDTTTGGSAAVAALWQKLIDTKSTLVEPRWGDGFKAALRDGKLIGTIGAAWEAPLLAGDMADTDNVGKWAVAQLPQVGPDAYSGPDGGSGVAVLKGCDHPAEAMEFNNWFNTQIDDLVSQGLVVAAEGTMTTPDSVKTFYGGQDVFGELATANAALNPELTYIPTFTAIGADMSAAAAAAGDGSGTVAAIFEAAQAASVKSLADAGLPVAK